MSHLQNTAWRKETRFLQLQVPGGRNERPNPVPASGALGFDDLGSQGGPVLVPDALSAGGVLN